MFNSLFGSPNAADLGGNRDLVALAGGQIFRRGVACGRSGNARLLYSPFARKIYRDTVVCGTFNGRPCESDLMIFLAVLDLHICNVAGVGVRIIDQLKRLDILDLFVSCIVRKFDRHLITGFIERKVLAVTVKISLRREAVCAVVPESDGGIAVALNVDTLYRVCELGSLGRRL